MRVYRIELVVTDSDVNAQKIAWLLEEAGDVKLIQEAK